MKRKTVKVKVKTTKWDVLDYLGTEEAVAGYLAAAAEEGDPRVLIMAIGDVARAQGVNALARKMNVSRESLYKSFSGKTKPNFETVFKALDSLGMRFSIGLKSAAAI
jgi:probable addiction module antidote protein